jgi:hypothetical protein
MKGKMRIVFVLLMVGLSSPTHAFSQGMSKDEIIKELNILKARLKKLESELHDKDREIQRGKTESVRCEKINDVVKEIKSDAGPLTRIGEHIQFNGLIEVGALRESVNNKDNSDISQSDLALSTVELSIGAEINEWVNAGITLLFEDPVFGGASDFSVDEGTVTIGNTEKCPLFFTGGAMYIPFGALLTHFPDDPLIDQPLTLFLGETREKAVLVGFEYFGFKLSGYVFNGDMDEANSENHIEHFGFDANYEQTNDANGLQLFIGASYINSMAEADGFTDIMSALGTTELRDCVGGFAAYLRLAYSNLFFDAEYMTAIDHFQTTELTTGAGVGARPSVWNLEAGFNWDWEKNLEVAFKYAGSDESENLGFQENRYGMAMNQTIFGGVIASLAFLHDEFDENDKDGREDRDVVFGQLAIGF